MPWMKQWRQTDAEWEREKHNRPVVHFRFKWFECLVFFSLYQDKIRFSYWGKQSIALTRPCVWRSQPTIDAATRTMSWMTIQWDFCHLRSIHRHCIRENCIQRNVLFHAINYFIINLPLMKMHETSFVVDWPFRWQCARWMAVSRNCSTLTNVDAFAFEKCIRVERGMHN